MTLYYCKHGLENNFILKRQPGKWFCEGLRVYMDVESKQKTEKVKAVFYHSVDPFPLKNIAQIHILRKMHQLTSHHGHETVTL